MAENVGRRYIPSTLVNANNPWRDELSDAIALQQSGPGVSRNTTEVTVDYTGAANLSDFMYANIQLNHDRWAETTIHPHIHWFQAATNHPNFLIGYRWQSTGATKITTWSYLACNFPSYTYSSGTIHQVSHTTPITAPSNTNLSDIIQFKIYRDNANNSGLFSGADAYGATVGVLAFDLHFQLDGGGSAQEYSKYI